jgi:hypothetical protein
MNNDLNIPDEFTVDDLTSKRGEPILVEMFNFEPRQGIATRYSKAAMQLTLNSQYGLFANIGGIIHE